MVAVWDLTSFAIFGLFTEKPWSKALERNVVYIPKTTSSHATSMTSKQTSGPSCSKLTTSLVNVSLKFQIIISQICQYFLLKKM